MTRRHGEETMLLTRRSHKSIKSLKHGERIAVMYLPSGAPEVCPWATEGCRTHCLIDTGRLPMHRAAQRRRLQLMRTAPGVFWEILRKEVKGFGSRHSTPVGIRLNGTSDFDWEADPRFQELVAAEGDRVHFYDYTKNHAKLLKRPVHKQTSYHLTASYHEFMTEQTVDALISRGYNVAFVYRGRMPESFMGWPVVDGDETDARWLDPVGVAVALKAKGSAMKDDTGFVVEADEVEGYQAKAAS